MNTELDDRFIMSPAPGGEMRGCADTGILLLEKSRHILLVRKAEVLVPKFSDK